MGNFSHLPVGLQSHTQNALPQINRKYSTGISLHLLLTNISAANLENEYVKIFLIFQKGYNKLYSVKNLSQRKKSPNLFQKPVIVFQWLCFLVIVFLVITNSCCVLSVCTL